MAQHVRAQARCQIPIVDRRRRIVGWTRTAPEYVAGVLRHSEAESKLKSAVIAAYVEVRAPEDARKAGAPADWQGSWRCLGLCDLALAEPKPADWQRSADDRPRPS